MSGSVQVRSSKLQSGESTARRGFAVLTETLETHRLVRTAGPVPQLYRVQIDHRLARPSSLYSGDLGRIPAARLRVQSTIIR